MDNFALRFTSLFTCLSSLSGRPRGGRWLLSFAYGVARQIQPIHIPRFPQLGERAGRRRSRSLLLSHYHILVTRTQGLVIIKFNSTYPFPGRGTTQTSVMARAPLWTVPLLCKRNWMVRMRLLGKRNATPVHKDHAAYAPWRDYTADRPRCLLQHLPPANCQLIVWARFDEIILNNFSEAPRQSTGKSAQSKASEYTKTIVNKINSKRGYVRVVCVVCVCCYCWE